MKELPHHRRRDAGRGLKLMLEFAESASVSNFDVTFVVLVAAVVASILIKK